MGRRADLKTGTTCNSNCVFCVIGDQLFTGDRSTEECVAELEASLGGQPVDLVISDMAPNISGIAMADQARAMDLAELALDFASNHLKPGGSFLVKVFHGAGFENFMREMRSRFAKVVARKPKASRDRSSEQYLLGLERLE